MKASNTYRQILKASALIGGSSMITVLIGIVRTKAMSILLGPAGFGLMGLYTSIIELTQSIAGMGVNNSGVRQIAEAVASGKQRTIAKTTRVLSQTSVVLGMLGTGFLFSFSTPLSEFTFENERYSHGIAILALAVFFNLIAAGQNALLQGMRRISELAKIAVIGSLGGTLLAIPSVYFLGEKGVALSLVFMAASAFCTSMWYRRKISLENPTMTASEFRKQQGDLLKLGFAFMISGLMMSGTAYVVRMLVVRHVGFDAAGLYQSAWTLGGLYVGFVLQALGTDFYPRLTAVANDNDECNRIVNEQAHVSLLLAGPGVIATLTLTPLVITLFYTSEFQGAVEVLRWLCLGMALRVVSWPLGYIIVAKGEQKIMIFAELAWTVVYLALAWESVRYFDLEGAGAAFFGSYIFHFLMVYLIGRRLSNFRFSSVNIKTNSLFLALILVVFWAFYELPVSVATGIGIIATGMSGIYSVVVILNLVSIERIPAVIERLFSRLKIVRSNDEYKHHDESSGVIALNVKDKVILFINRLIWMIIFLTFGLICMNKYINSSFV